MNFTKVNKEILALTIFYCSALQAQELLEEWNPVDVEDALELLSSQFTNRAVRQYAVSRLKEANDDVRGFMLISTQCSVISLCMHLSWG